MIATGSNISPTNTRPFRFRSYGVNVRIDGNRQDLIDDGENVARVSLLGRIEESDAEVADLVFRLDVGKRGKYRMCINDDEITSGGTRRLFLKFFDSIVRASVAELAVDRVFLHAGVVGWKGKAIVLPADSFKGKSTLVSELVRNGADYYSDDFAIFDEAGLVHSFPRPMGMRTTDGKFRAYQVTVESLGGTYGMDPIPVGLVLLTDYHAGSRFTPRILSSGQGVMQMIPFTFPIRHRTEFALRVLNIIARDAIIASSRRGTAENFAKILLKFVDNNVV